jgi:hypothetical protein
MSLQACNNLPSKAEKAAKYVFMTGHQTTVQNHYIKLKNKPSKNVAKFKHLETTVTNQNSIQE